MPLFISILQDMPPSEVVNEGLAYRLFILLAAIVVAYITRFFLIRGMKKRMMIESKKAGPAPKDDHPQVRSSRPLNIKEQSADIAFPEAVGIRNTYLKEARKGLLILFAVDAFMIVVYAVLGMDLDPIGMFEWASDEAILMGYKLYYRYYIYLACFAVWVVGRLVGSMMQFKAYHKGLFGFFTGIGKRIFWLFNSHWVVAWGVIVMLNSALTGAVSVEYPIVAAVVVHLGLWIWLKRGSRKQNNHKLLILRVFKIKSTSMFTFSRMVGYWKHFGSYFTVADPTFYAINWKKRFNRYFPIYVILIFVVFTLMTNDVQSLGQLQQLFGGFVLLMIMVALVHVILRIRSMKRSFVSSESDLRARLAKLDRWPKNLDNTFKEMPVMCYDNTWKRSVEVLAEASSVVMMDLRGFSESNKGCEYEVHFLFDHVPLDRLLFIAYADSAQLVRDTIRKCWEEIETGSPNLEVDHPEVTLLLTNDQDKEEMQAILDRLIWTASKGETN